jgi:hypothetical protein
MTLDSAEVDPEDLVSIEVSSPDHRLNETFPAGEHIIQSPLVVGGFDVIYHALAVPLPTETPWRVTVDRVNITGFG